MSMYGQYGGYRHELDEFTISHDISPVTAANGYRKFDKHTITINGVLHGTSVSNLTDEMNALMRAYSLEGQQFGLYESTGRRTAHILPSQNAVGGVRVVQGPKWVETEGAEYTTYRSYSITLEALYPSNDVRNIAAQEETITVIGNGGPKRRWINTTDLGPVRQETLPSTLVRIIQQGTIVGTLTHPFPPPALFPQLLVNEAVSITRSSATNMRGTIYDFATNYTYPMESRNAIQPYPLTLR